MESNSPSIVDLSSILPASDGPFEIKAPNQPVDASFRLDSAHSFCCVPKHLASLPLQECAAAAPQSAALDGNASRPMIQLTMIQLDFSTSRWKIHELEDASPSAKAEGKWTRTEPTRK